MLKLSDFLKQFDIACYKDDIGNYYLECLHNQNYFPGSLIKTDCLEDIPSLLPDQILSKYTEDCFKCLGDPNCKTILQGISKTTCTPKEVIAAINRSIINQRIPKDKVNIARQQIEKMRAILGNLEDDITNTDLTVIIYQMLQQKKCIVQEATPSYGTDGIVCHFGDNEFCFHKNCTDSLSLNTFIQENYSNVEDVQLYFAKDIANTMKDMMQDAYFQDEVLYYLYLCYENLPDFYHPVILQYIDMIKENVMEFY